MAEKLGFTQREKAMNLASLYYWGEQYSDLEPWETTGVPLREKQPSVQIGMTRKSINKVAGHLFGEGRRPIWKVEAKDGKPAAEAVNKALQAIQDEIRLEGHYPELGRLGPLHGTVAVAFHLFDGRLDLEIIHAAGAKPKFGRDNRRVAVEREIDFDDLIELDEFWRTTEEDELGEEQEWWHKRRFELDRTVEYAPIPGPITDPRQLDFKEDPELTVHHDLGFVPIAWITPIPVAHDIDGAPIVSEAEFRLEDEINYTLSQTGRGIRYNQEPTLAFVNVNTKATSVKRGADNTIQVESMGDGPGADVRLLEMGGNGATVAMDYVRMIRNLFNEIVQTVDHDPEQFAGALSGVALERLMYPLVMLVQNLRGDYEYKLGRLLKRMLAVRGHKGDFRVTAQWPPVVEPTSRDLLDYTIAIKDLLFDRIISHKKAVEVLAPFLNIDDVENFLAEVTAEAVSRSTMLDEEDDEDDPGSDGGL